jgi:hypothetical protein
VAHKNKKMRSKPGVVGIKLKNYSIKIISFYFLSLYCYAARFLWKEGYGSVRYDTVPAVENGTILIICIKPSAKVTAAGLVHVVQDT